MPYVMDEWEFKDRQACEFMQVESQRLFENGAVWYHDGSYFDPVSDPVQQAKNRLAYYRIARKRLALEYNEIRDGVEESARMAKRFPSTCMPPEVGWEKELKWRRAKIKALETKLRELEAQAPVDPRLARIAERQEELDQRSMQAHESQFEVSLFPRLPNS